MSADKQKPSVEEFVERLVDLARQAEKLFVPGEIFFAMNMAAVRYAGGHITAGEVAEIFRSMVRDLEDVQRAQQPVDPKSVN
jgi:hypothetical protein